jgi:hypothetical protein
VSPAKENAMLRVAVPLVSLLAVAAAAQITSGPNVGEASPALKVFAATGSHAGKELNYTTERGEKPTVFVLIREFDRPVGRFLKVLDGAVREDSAQAEVVAVWLTDKQEETRTYLPRVQMSIKLEATAFTVFPGDKNGPENWNVNPDARVTVAVANKGKVTATFGYASVNETDVGEVRMALKKAL